MSDENPFAWCRQVGEEVCIEADDGFVVARFALDVASQSEYTKDALNYAVAARERKAAAKALRELAASVRCTTGVLDPKPSDPFWRDYFATVAETQAAALEGGAK